MLYDPDLIRAANALRDFARHAAGFTTHYGPDAIARETLSAIGGLSDDCGAFAAAVLERLGIAAYPAPSDVFPTDTVAGNMRDGDDADLAAFMGAEAFSHDAPPLVWFVDLPANVGTIAVVAARNGIEVVANLACDDGDDLAVWRLDGPLTRQEALDTLAELGTRQFITDVLTYTDHPSEPPCLDSLGFAPSY